MKLAKARTEEEDHIALEELGTEIGADQKKWWLSRQHQYATHTFLDKGVKRYTKTLSNGAEQMNTKIIQAKRYKSLHRRTRDRVHITKHFMIRCLMTFNTNSR